MKLFLLLMILAAPPTEESDPLPVDLPDGTTIADIVSIPTGPQDLVFVDSDKNTVNLYLDTCTWDAPAPGNAGAALAHLLGWAEQHPEAVWSVR